MKTGSWGPSYLDFLHVDQNVDPDFEGGFKIWTNRIKRFKTFILLRTIGSSK
jgi:hypothetical protein